MRHNTAPVKSFGRWWYEAVGPDRRTVSRDGSGRRVLDVPRQYWSINSTRTSAVVLERLTERPELLAVPVGVDGHCVDQVIDLVAHCVGHYGLSRAA